MRKSPLLFLTVFVFFAAEIGAAQQPPEKPLFRLQKVMIPMRDGVRLQTVILTLADQQGPLPILFRRTPYGVPEKPPEQMPASWKELAQDGYIFVIQNLRGRDHVFLKGHRLMVQIQFTWFPLIDRNPQKFVPSIYQATAADFVAATQRVYCSAQFPSHIVLPVVAKQ